MRLFKMTLVLCSLACAAGVLPAFSAQSHAQEYGWDAFWHRTHVSYKRMNHYPEPFIYADRAAARAPFCVMVANGWQLQNTLGAHYFNPETQKLTRAGELHVRWVVTQAPEQYRTVYVARGVNQEVTSIRVDEVQQAIARILPSGPLPQVVETGTELRGVPGDYVDDTYRKAYASQPAPILPANSGGSTGGT